MSLSKIICKNLLGPYLGSCRLLCVAIFLAGYSLLGTEAVPFAENGGLKMLYDNRMYPQAVELEGKLYIVWRGSEGFPYAKTYDLRTREFSEPVMLLMGLEDTVDHDRYRSDHHFAPVIWKDHKEFLHVLFGCHRTKGIHMVSQNPRDISRWTRASDVAESLSYPKFHWIFDDQILVYYRHTGHLGHWNYRISGDDGKSWQGPIRGLINMSAEPQTGFQASHAGSYQTTRISENGKTLHIAFIWKVEDPLPSFRYGKVLHDHLRRHNLYYMKVDLTTGKAYNYEGKELPLPVNKAVADSECLVWDTSGRVAAVGPSIHLSRDGEPSLLLPISGTTPLLSKFYFVRRKKEKWVRTAIAQTGHPFNSSHLYRDENGQFHAYLITAQSESIPVEGMDFYGWGSNVQHWISSNNGRNWNLKQDLTPKEGSKYQNIQFVAKGPREISEDIFLFYGWDSNEGSGTGYLWDGRP